MSATNFTPIQLYRTTTASATPSAGNLADGELAINLTDEALYFKNAAGVVKLLADSSGALGTVTSVDVSGGTTGLTTSGGPITSSGTITLAGTLGVANGGTGTATAFTAGSVVFAGASGVYTQDNANLFWDNANDRLGIGTATPGSKLDVVGTINASDGTNGNIRAYVDGTSAYLQSLNQAANAYRPLLVMGSTVSFANNGVTNVTIDASGRLLIGQTTNPNNFYLIANTGSASNNNAALFTNAVDADLSIKLTSGVSLLSPSTGVLAFGTSNTERMRIDSSGNVGIGVTPSASTTFPALEIGAGNCILGASGFVDYTMNAYYNGSYRYKANGTASYYEQTGGSHVWLNAASGTAGNAISFTERMRIDASGNVGIGTSSPTSRVTISSGQFTSPALNIIGGGPNQGWLRLGNNADIKGGDDLLGMTFTVGASERMKIDTVGNVGIGTSSPTDLLTVSNGSIASTIAGSGANIQMGRIAMYSTAFGAAYTNYGGEIRSFCGGGVDVSDLRFYTALGAPTTERMRIDSSGSLLIGTTSTLAAGFKQNIQLDSGQGGTIYKNSIDGSYALQFLNAAGSTSGWIQVNTATTTYNSISDVRLKHDIVDAPEASSLIDAIQVRSFKWNADNTEQRYGFIAQELVEVAPEAVSQQTDPEGMMGVDYSKLVPMLVKELQSVRARLAQLEGN